MLNRVEPEKKKWKKKCLLSPIIITYIIRSFYRQKFAIFFSIFRIINSNFGVSTISKEILSSKFIRTKINPNYMYMYGRWKIIDGEKLYIFQHCFWNLNLQLYFEDNVC